VKGRVLNANVSITHTKSPICMKLDMNNMHVYNIATILICKSCSTSIVHSNCFLPCKPGFLLVFELLVSVKHMIIFGMSFRTFGTFGIFTVSVFNICTWAEVPVFAPFCL